MSSTQASGRRPAWVSIAFSFQWARVERLSRT
jgi:hypothetical protein